MTYLNADGSPRSFPWWYYLLLVGIASVFFPLLLTGWIDNLFFKRAHLQRWTVILAVGLLQIMRLLLAWVVWELTWTWLAWIVGIMIVWRVWNTANVWWALIEDPATWSTKKGDLA